MKFLCATLMLCLLPAQRLCAQVSADDQLNLGVPQQPKDAPPEPASPETIGLPYSQIMRDTEPPYENLFRDVKVGGRFDQKIGPGDLFLQTRLFSGPSFNAPLFGRGVRPQDAELKIGRFYLDVRSVSGGLIYSDNVSLRETNERDDVIGIVRLNAAVMLQITERLRLATYGSLIWLPFKNKFGVAGFGIDDPFAQFQTWPFWQSQLNYEFTTAKWDVQVVDDFRIRHRRFGAVGSVDLFDGERFDEEDRAGRLVFNPNAPLAPDAPRDRSNRFGEEFFEIRNLVGATASRLLPTDTRMRVGAYHSDFWYTGTKDNVLPSSRDSAFVALISERETLRFKPFARYRVSRRDSNEWDQEASVGARGPITENLNVLGSVGWFDSGEGDRQTYIARARLRHTPGPMTFHEIEFHRGATEPDFGIETSWRYLLRQVLGPDFYGELFAFKSDFEDLQGTGTSGNEWRAGVRLTHHFGRHLTLRATGTWVQFDFDEDFDPDTNPGARGDYEGWVGRFEAFYRFTRSLHARLIYQYQTRDSTRPGESYNENLVGLDVIKYF